MFALRIARQPLFTSTAAKCGNIASTTTALSVLAAKTRLKFLNLQNKKRKNNITFISITPFAFTAARFYTAKPGNANTPKASSFDKEKLEKYFFRTIGIVWDASYRVFIWSNKNFNKHVVQHPTVKMYWNRFLQKIEDAKKD